MEGLETGAITFYFACYVQSFLLPVGHSLTNGLQILETFWEMFLFRK